MERRSCCSRYDGNSFIVILGIGTTLNVNGRTSRGIDTGTLYEMETSFDKKNTKTDVKGETRNAKTCYFSLPY